MRIRHAGTLFEVFSGIYAKVSIFDLSEALIPEPSLRIFFFLKRVVKLLITYKSKQNTS